MFVAPPGSDAERRLGAREGVHHLVDRAVAGEDDDEVDAVVHGLGCELVRVAALLGLRDLEAEVGRQRLLDHGERGLGDRPCDGVHDEEDAMETHGASAEYVRGRVSAPRTR